MASQDIFKQAIAEAKAVREAAISNAKDVMEESLTPHLKDMLAAKLQEMEAEEMDETVEEEVVEEEAIEEEAVEETVEETVEEEAVEEGSYDKDEMEEGQGNIDANEENPHDQLEEEEVEEAPVAEEDEPAEDESEESEDEAEAEEGEEEAEEVEDMKIDDLKALIRDIIAQEMGHGEEPGMEDEEGGMEDMVAADDEEINLDELLAELEALSEDLDEDLEEEVSEESVEEMKHDDEEKMEEGKKEEEMDEEVSEEVEESTELNEALATIETLRNELSEVNLLNSKLLYVNKIFKANNLSETQKVNIIATFDKAETVKEVKLVYETVAENITSVKSEKSNIKEHKSFASKATGNSTKGEVISEVSEQVRRMQRLAGIIK